MTVAGDGGGILAIPLLRGPSTRITIALASSDKSRIALVERC